MTEKNYIYLDNLNLKLKKINKIKFIIILQNDNYFKFPPCSKNRFD